MSDDWASFSEPQLHVIAMLDFAMPVHEGYARHRLGCAAASITALERKGFLQRTSYREQPSLPNVPFLTLTPRGQKLRRNYIRWHRRLGAELGRLPTSMKAIAELRL